jgi:hypothetical protein
MPSRAWIAAIALGLIHASGAALTQAPEGIPSPPTVQQESQQENSEETESVPSGRLAIDASHVHDQEAGDTPAQDRATNVYWDRYANAWWLLDDVAAQAVMAWAAIIAIVLTFIGVVLLGFTLRYTKKAAIHTEGMLDQARLTTQAAIGMNNLTEAIEQPLLGIKMQDPAGFDGQGRFKSQVYFSIVNMGRSPAKVTAIDRRWYASPDSTHPPVLVPGERHLTFTKDHHRYVAGGSETENIACRVQDYKPGPETPKLIFFYGWIRFEDMNGKKFVAGFSYFITPGSDNGFAMAWPAKDADKYNYCRKDE